jgi:hypothetical protein
MIVQQIIYILRLPIFTDFSKTSSVRFGSVRHGFLGTVRVRFSSSLFFKTRFGLGSVRFRSLFYTKEVDNIVGLSLSLSRRLNERKSFIATVSVLLIDYVLKNAPPIPFYSCISLLSWVYIVIHQSNI